MGRIATFDKSVLSEVEVLGMTIWTCENTISFICHLSPKPKDYISQGLATHPQLSKVSIKNHRKFSYSTKEGSMMINHGTGIARHTEVLSRNKRQLK
jgi:hypothetical protein